MNLPQQGATTLTPWGVISTRLRLLTRPCQGRGLPPFSFRAHNPESTTCGYLDSVSSLPPYRLIYLRKKKHMLRLCIVGAFLFLSAFSSAWADNLVSDDTSSDSFDLDLPVTVDLTKPFQTVTPWTLTISQDQENQDFSGSALRVCFTHEGKQSCSHIIVPDCAVLTENSRCDADPFPSYFDRLFGVESVRPKNGAPLLVLLVGSSGAGGPGQPYGPIVFAYRRSGKFERVFTDTRSSNSNGEARVIEDGPLAGYIVEDSLTYQKWPYPYFITVYRPTATEHYEQVLGYLGRSHESDGNSLGVIDAEIPEVMKRLGVWHAGQSLPVPGNNPFNCTDYILKNGLEWCGYSQ